MERITLNMVPTGVLEICHASQYDIGREIRFDLIDGTDDFVLSGDEDITIFIRDFEGNLIESSAPNTSSNYVVWTSSEGELDVSGPAICELRVTKDDDVLGSANFIMEIEADAYDGAGVQVETVGPADICAFETNLPEPLNSVIVDVSATGGNGTPDNPNPINGYSSANITRCGVNLFDDDNLIIANYPYSSMTFDKATYLKAGTYTASISNVENASSWRFGYRFFNADGTIITSAITNGLVSFTAGTAFLDAYDSNQTCLQASDNTETSVKFTLTKDTYIVGCISNGNVGASTTLDYQIELGSTATAYTPYNGQTYTIAFGQTVYGGVLDVTRGKLHVTHEFLVFDGTENYQNDWFPSVVCNQVIPVGSGSGVDIISSHCPSLNTWINYANSSKNTIVFNRADTNWGVTSATELKNLIAQWYSNGEPLQMIYPLATPFDIDLTPEVISAIVGTNNVFADCGQSTVKYLKAGA